MDVQAAGRSGSKVSRAEQFWKAKPPMEVMPSPVFTDRSDLQFWKQAPGMAVMPSPSVTEVIFVPLKVVPPEKLAAMPFVAK